MSISSYLRDRFCVFALLTCLFILLLLLSAHTVSRAEKQQSIHGEVAMQAELRMSFPEMGY